MVNLLYREVASFEYIKSKVLFVAKDDQILVVTVFSPCFVGIAKGVSTQELFSKVLYKIVWLSGIGIIDQHCHITRDLN